MDPDDPFLLKVKTSFEELPKLVGSGFMADYVPFLQYKMFETKALKKTRAINDYIMNYFNKQIDEHMETFDPGKTMLLVLKLHDVNYFDVKMSNKFD